MHGGENFEATIRRAERLLLDHLQDAPGDRPRPAPCLFDLVLAVELGERMLAGNCCCTTMKHRLSKVKGESPDPLSALLAAIAAKRGRA
jgi:hypothetical protein